jgi:hypothetical protein
LRDKASEREEERIDRLQEEEKREYECVSVCLTQIERMAPKSR